LVSPVTAKLAALVIAAFKSNPPAPVIAIAPTPTLPPTSASKVVRPAPAATVVRLDSEITANPQVCTLRQ